MRILIIGASGLIGSHVLKSAHTGEHVVVGTYRRQPGSGLVQLDCADGAAVDALLRAHKPEVVIHAAGWTWVDGCEDDPVRAFAENAEQPARLAEQCKKAGCRFAYFSSSYVFDGKAGPYVEDAMPNPINVYGRSKRRAEQDIQAADSEALLLRVVCVYGAEVQGKNFAYQVRRAMESGQELKVPEDQRGNPTYAGDIARWLLKLLQQEATGIWHLAGPWPECTRLDWARRLVSAWEKAGVRRHAHFSVKAVTTAQLQQRAMRPLNAGLLTPKADALGSRPTDFDQTVLEMARADK